MSRLCLVLLSCIACRAHAETSALEASMGKNPIRKVVTLLQDMQRKVTAEGEKAADLHSKFLCYCKTGAASLSASIDAAGTKTAELESSIKASTELLAKTKSDLKDDQASRADAKKTMSEATAMREKEAAAFKAEKNEYEANIAAVAKATAAVEAGMSGSFLQTPGAGLLQKLVAGGRRTAPAMLDYDRKEMLSFLSASASYAPQSGEITGILKTMSDEMAASLKQLIATETAAIDEYNGLMSAKTKEVNALTKSVESKLEKVSDLGVSIADMKNDLGDTGAQLMEDKKFLADLEKNCATADADFEADSKTRNQELAALSDTIKLLNGDDALELFKKTLPGASSSFLEIRASASELRERALVSIRAAQAAAQSRHPQLDFIAMALRGKKIGFDKVIGMIDDMVKTLKKEQGADDDKKSYCSEQFDLSDDKKKALETSYKDVVTSIANTEESIASTKEEIAALTAGIKALDKSVADATAQRKAENTEFKELMASDTAAKELLGFAKNRLNKFYNPKLYRPPAKKELAADDRIVENMGSAAVLVQVEAHSHKESIPPPPPVAEAYKSKSEESGGVIAMMDLLIQDLDKEMTTAETSEKDAQADYEGFLKDSQEKRTQDSKSLTDKEAALGGMEADLLAAKDSKKSTAKELSATMKYISSLHAECDWLLQYFDVRKEARTSEIDALGKAKAVLGGADYSLVETRRFLQRA